MHDLPRLAARLLRHLCLVAGLAMAAVPALAEPLQLDGRAAIDVWPAVRVLADERNAYSVEQLLDQAQRFEPTQGTPGNLGRRAGTVWLRVQLIVPGVEPVRRVLEIDYPALNHADLYVLRGGQLQSHHRMGNALLRSERALATRTHAAPLLLAPGEHELLLRVQTLSSVVLPFTVRSAEDFTRYESQVQLVQGVLVGLALCMLLYSLAHWVSLRDRVFLDYAFLLLGNVLFSLSYFGIGAQYVWTDWPQVSTQIAPMGIMVAVAAGARFTRATLAVHEVSKVADLLLRVTGGAALAGLAAMLLGVLGYRSAQTLVTVLGIAVTLLVLPVAAMRSWRGERVATYTLIGWAFYTLGALTTAGILRGLVEPTFWSQHVYPFSTMIEMAAWMAVLGLRVKAIHSNADRARVESETLRAMAHTDALTGLPNRRGLNDRLGLALRDAVPGRMLAVYLMDLDGFKPVNDRHGHDVGDALLVAAGQRLQAQLRGQDVVARLGGDEFVVLASGLADEAAAQALGHKLLTAFNAPFDANGQRCEVGLTIGYALAPLDGGTADELLKRADAAMYAGKAQGRRRVQRGGRSTVGVNGLPA
jgi:diguanylate cyclase (GGDEF)-like protein